MTMVKGFQEISYDELMDVGGGLPIIVPIIIIIALLTIPAYGGGSN